jgi:hypothetical protein
MLMVVTSIEVASKVKVNRKDKGYSRRRIR